MIVIHKDKIHNPLAPLSASVIFYNFSVDET